MNKTSRPQILAVVAARAGSKGLPGKNIMPILGRPAIAYSIEHGQRSRFVHRTIVSTDDPEIREIALKCGGEAPFLRPKEYAEDLSPDIDVFVHALQWLKENEGFECDYVVHLRASGPARRVETIDAAIQKILKDPRADSLRSVSPSPFTPYKMWRPGRLYMTPALRLEGVEESQSMPRQMLPQFYWQNGYVDVIRSTTILEKGSMCGERVLPFVINEPNLEIDYIDNVPAVEAAIADIQQGVAPRQTPSEVRHSV